MKPDGIYKGITTISDLEQLCHHIDQTDILAVDTETTSLDTLNTDLLGISLSPEPGYGYYIPIQQELSGEQLSLFDRYEEYLDLETVKYYIAQYLISDRKKYFHNAKFDLHVLERHGFPVSSDIFDTMIGAWVLANIKHKVYKLKVLVREKFNIEMLEFKEVTKFQSFDKLPLQQAVDYAAPDSDMTLRLGLLEEEILQNYPKLQNVMALELKVIPVLMEMERNGVHIDQAFLQQASAELKKDINYYTGEIYKTARRKFNIRSPQQVLSVLNNCIDTKQISNTKEETLEEIINEHPLVELILEFRKREKLKSTFVDGILHKLDKRTGKLHTDFYQMLLTGRCSSSPNMQNLPTEYQLGKRNLPLVRSAIIAEPGWKIVSIDYSQLELRVVTHLSQDPTWLNAYLNDKDVHQETADIIEQPRKSAKTVNFALIYGTSAFGLAPRLEMTVPETYKFIDNYFSKLPGVRKYIEDRKNEIRTRGYVETIFGRRLYFKLNSDPKKRAASEREGVNFPVQGSASGDIVKTAMVEVYKYIVENNLDIKMLLQVHDEIVFACRDEDLPKMFEIKDIMENVVELSIPLRCDLEYGQNWQDMKELKYENN